MRAAITTGMLMRNTDPHQNRSNSAPPTMGPSAAPTTEMLPQIAIAMFRSRTSSNPSRISARVAGIMHAAPTARSARAPIRTSGVGENAATSDAAPKSVRPTRKRRRCPNRSPKVPDPSSRPAITSG